MKFIIIQDTKEKQPWNFIMFQECKGQICRGLTTGDYTLDGYEHDIIIERKHSTGELAINLGLKLAQFESELDRMQAIPNRYIVCEFPESDIFIFPIKSGIPKNRWSKLRMSGKFIHKKLFELCSEYNIDLIFCTDKQDAEHKVIQLFKNYVNNKS